MADKSEIAILLINRNNEEQLGLIVFKPSGMLGYQNIQNRMPWFALRSVQAFLERNGLTKSLYVKHAQHLDERDELPPDILEQEAHNYAKVINEKEPPLSIGAKNIPIRAVVVHTGDNKR
jgi:hypothetical protein